MLQGFFRKEKVYFKHVLVFGIKMRWCPTKPGPGLQVMSGVKINVSKELLKSFNISILRTRNEITKVSPD